MHKRNESAKHNGCSQDSTFLRFRGKHPQEATRPQLALSGGRSSRIQDAYMQYRLPSYIIPPSYRCFKKKSVKINFHFVKNKIRHQFLTGTNRKKILKYLVEFWPKNDRFMDHQRKHLSTSEPVSTGLSWRDALVHRRNFPGKHSAGWPHSRMWAPSSK